MQNSRLIKISKYLSYHLRHHPEELGLELAAGGWVSVEKLLYASSENGFSISRKELEEVVKSNDKQRFSLDVTGNRIRANQGHSISVDLQLQSMQPPQVLYHGTSDRAVSSILETGLQKMSRHHVHLSTDIETAKKVGSRRGRSVVFIVDAAAMFEDGYQFFCSENQVWLVDRVPPQYIKHI
ncbi:MAG: RNA 2'-phosphotransferase [Xenococcaceae cyanobacterium]